VVLVDAAGAEMGIPEELVLVVDPAFPEQGGISSLVPGFQVIG